MFCFNSLCSISPFSHMVTFRCAISLLIKWRKTLHCRHYTSLSNLLSYPVTMIDGPSLSAFECLYYTAMCMLEWEGERGRFLFLINKHPWKKNRSRSPFSAIIPSLSSQNLLNLVSKNLHVFVSNQLSQCMCLKPIRENVYLTRWII